MMNEQSGKSGRSIRDRAQSSIKAASQIAKSNPTLISHKNQPIIIPDGGYGWVVVFSGFFVQFFILGLANSFGIFLPAYVKAFGKDPGQVAWVGSISGGMIATLAAFSGQLADKLGNRTVVIIGSLIIFVSFFLASICEELWQLYLTQGLMAGVGFSFAFLAGVSVVGQWFTTKRGLATGICLSGAGVGQLIFAIITNLMIEQIGWRMTLRYLAIILLGGLLTCSIGISRLLPCDTQTKFIHCDGCHWLTHSLHTMFPSFIPDYEESEDSQEHTHELLQKGGDQTNKGQSSSKKTLKDEDNFSIGYLMRHNTNFLFFYMTIFVASLGLSMPASHLTNYAILEGYSGSAAALLISIAGIGSAIGRSLLGYLADKFGKVVMLQVCLLCSGGFTLCWIGLNSFGLLAAYAFLIGLFTGGFYTLIPAVGAELFGVKKLGSVLGALYTSCTVGDLTAAPIGGFIYAVSSSYTPAIIFAAAMMLGSIVFTFGMSIESNKKDDTSVKYEKSVDIDDEDRDKQDSRLPTTRVVSKHINTGASTSNYDIQNNEESTINKSKIVNPSLAVSVDMEMGPIIKGDTKDDENEVTDDNVVISLLQSESGKFDNENDNAINVSPAKKMSIASLEEGSIPRKSSVISDSSEVENKKNATVSPSLKTMGLWRPSIANENETTLPMTDARTFRLGSYEEGGAYKFGISMR